MRIFSTTGNLIRAAFLGAALFNMLDTPEAFADHRHDWNSRHDGWHDADRRYDRRHRHDRHGWNDYPPYYRTHRPSYDSYTRYAPVAVVPSVISCTTRYNPLPAIAGGVGGGVIGAQIGKGHGRTAAIITGAVLGGSLGNQYTYADEVCSRRVFETAPVGRSLYWQNADTGYEYTITPVKDYQADNSYCREYTATALVGGSRQETYGTACYRPDGSWEIVN